MSELKIMGSRSGKLYDTIIQIESLLDNFQDQNGGIILMGMTAESFAAKFKEITGREIDMFKSEKNENYYLISWH